MKRYTLIFGFLLVFAFLFASCRSQKQACAAYSKVELPKGNDINS